MTLHLDGDSFNCQYSDQSNIAVRQFCNHIAEILSLKTVHDLVLSANYSIVTPAWDRVLISLTYNINNKGPSTLPWGTPLITGKIDEKDLSTLTY